jgi:pimeloyl-ACP methyl ester carboxylesterase
MSASSNGLPTPAGAGSISLQRRLRSAIALGAVAIAVIAIVSVLSWPSVASGSPSTPTRLGSVAGAPDLPTGFKHFFKDRYVDTGDVRLHAVVGGDGPPLLLIHGWPETWYAWRLVMPALAQHFQVVAVDQRGIGLSDKPATGYDTRTAANDLVTLMDKLGHPRFALVGVDTGMPIAYALAADHRDRVDRLVAGEAVLAGVTPSPPMFANAQLNDALWHIPFNRLTSVNEQLVKGREDIYFGAKLHGLPASAVNYYVQMLRSSPNSLRGSFGQYRAWDVNAEQNQQRMAHPLTLPVLAIGGEKALGQNVIDTMNRVAANVQGLIIPNTGHWLAEEAPDQMVTALTNFLKPYETEHPAAQ